MSQGSKDSREIDDPSTKCRHRLAVDRGPILPVDRADPWHQIREDVCRGDAGRLRPVDVQLPEDLGVQERVKQTDRELAFDRLEFPPVIVHSELQAMIPRDPPGLIAVRNQVSHPGEGVESRVARPAVPDDPGTPALVGELRPMIDVLGRGQVAMDRDDGQVMPREASGEVFRRQARRQRGELDGRKAGRLTRPSA